MGFLAFLILGIIAGVIAKLIIPGRQGGWVSTIVCGVIGAVLGGWIGSAILRLDLNGNFWLSLIFAVIGALIVLLIWGFITGRRRTAA